jgi:hypothetical protein
MELAGVSLDNVQKLISDYKFFKLSSDEMQNYVLEMGKNGEYISDKQMKFFSEHWPNIQKEYLINMHKNGKTISDKQISVLKYDNKLFYEFLKLSNNERLKNVIDHLSMFKNSVGDGDDGDYYLSPVYVPKYKFYLLTPEQQKIVAEFKLNRKLPLTNYEFDSLNLKDKNHYALQRAYMRTFVNDYKFNHLDINGKRDYTLMRLEQGLKVTSEQIKLLTPEELNLYTNRAQSLVKKW